MSHHDNGCGNCGDSGHSHGGGMWSMDCCEDHKISKEHLEAKKKHLEDKLAWVKEELEKM
ncbi:hypothetical protein A3D80_03660 [Candidatus Roizmanbacteria bacterium RIFCSPHIGHO2_02_FULL_40_13b]|uniref:Uncharacterized protein n=1 Tax=Candidatus Roizmanbacteria bacterium RIFCSPHIGHO2_01_FULL_39_24 TaxID=1802032 RepID=A0A1F7GJ72_9BACT|nr:MAG: hypothetical protein A2799_04150 [Candidatus Roizmanbacteria bacterium RIFCSPHIGHO2_01_FULL_39_24]OGK27060.1 MAG: hypothetical protein A3D80_03660 [Candidatus Roizmanbacteria bacterium RIFCSPHIGHO2_02_FULL_40_13b]OGK48784.1 MAG: hypothetical protein A3A56_01060 [Candidatus Roizmanbacteria bacterium RIFCSPLOWO2_01_FULL_40_32]OGK56841.1 MAG: hypothetical protein A3H83_01215 [Candidatus Roizmanbacteria bacterium RIFCSPLOWO2_02_FULL_39_8]